MVAGLPYAVSQAGATCSYDISPNSRSHGNGATTGAVEVRAGVNCNWTIVNSNTWITITSPTSGFGSNTVHYTVAENHSLNARTGVVVIDGLAFTVSQQGAVCAYTISPAARSHGPSTAMNTVEVRAESGCGWTVINANTWITINSPTSGAGSNVVSYTVANNLMSTSRSGVVVMAGQTFAVAQQGADCGYSISPSTRTHGFGSTSGWVSVTAASSNCVWSIVNTNDWITITSPTNGAGNGLVSYTVNANFGIMMRTGVVVIAENQITLAQRGANSGFDFDHIAVQPDGSVDLLLVGGPGGLWELQRSEDLKNWETVSYITNITGRVAFTNKITTPVKKLFYRAVQR